LTNHSAPSGCPSTTIVHRPLGGVSGYRRFTDQASRVSVHAFPLSALPGLASAGVQLTAGCYVLTDHRTAYIGESGRPARRLGEHGADPAKIVYAREVFVVTACDGCAFDKATAADLQFRFTALAAEAGVVRVAKGADPVAPALTDADRSTHDRIAEDALRLLYDAGCRIFRPSGEVQPDPAQAEECIDPADAGPMEIGVVTTVPLGTEEHELRYLDVWARAYWAGGHFVVAAGSEVRSTTNGSVSALTRSRREELFRAGVLAPIPGVAGRRRLVVAVAFSSMSIAAKVLCGAHTAGRWTALTPARAVVIAA
jgi:hypothetical protein